MDVTRRRFFTGAAALAAAAATPGRLLAAVESRMPPLPDLSRYWAGRSTPSIEY